MTEIVKAQQEVAPLNLYVGNNFETMQRVAKMFASSAIVPPSYQSAKVGEPQAVANCFIALQVAQELKISNLTTIQNLFIIQGRPSWSSPFIISCFNACGRFSPIQYIDNFEQETDRTKWYCMATAKDKAGNVYKGTRITWTMAESEGWTKKPGSKWLTMPEQMFKYRAAAFFIRAVAPEILMGLRPYEEEEDIQASNEQKQVIEDAQYSVIVEPAKVEPKQDCPSDAERHEWNDLVTAGLFEKAEETLADHKKTYPNFNFSTWDFFLKKSREEVEKAK